MEPVQKGFTVPGWLDLKVSLGNLITMGGLCVAGIVGYARMDGRVSTSEAALAKTEITYVRKDVSELRERALTDKLDDLKAQLSRVEQKLDDYKIR